MWDRSGHQWAFPAISELATLFPWRAVKAKSEGKRVICKYPFHLCGLENQQIYPKDGQCEPGYRSSWLIQHSAQPSKHKDWPELPLASQGQVPLQKAILLLLCWLTAQWDPRHLFKATSLLTIKNGVLFLPCWGPTGALCLLQWRRERAEWAPGVLNYCSKLSDHLVGPALMDLKGLFRFIYLKKEMAGLRWGGSVQRNWMKGEEFRVRQGCCE